VNNLHLSSYRYVNSCNILYKKKKANLYGFTCKFLEIFCDNLITLNQFKKFVKKMKKVGFSSNNKTTIEFINTITNDNIYCYEFQTIKEIKPDEYKKLKNCSRYVTKNIFIKK
jgi:hypothetical protein